MHAARQHRVQRAPVQLLAKTWTGADCIHAAAQWNAALSRAAPGGPMPRLAYRFLVHTGTGVRGEESAQDRRLPRQQQQWPGSWAGRQGQAAQEASEAGRLLGAAPEPAHPVPLDLAAPGSARQRAAATGRTSGCGTGRATAGSGRGQQGASAGSRHDRHAVHDTPPQWGRPLCRQSWGQDAAGLLGWAGARQGTAGGALVSIKKKKTMTVITATQQAKLGQRSGSEQAVRERAGRGSEGEDAQEEGGPLQGAQHAQEALGNDKAARPHSRC